MKRGARESGSIIKFEDHNSRKQLDIILKPGTADLFS